MSFVKPAANSYGATLLQARFRGRYGDYPDRTFTREHNASFRTHHPP